MDCTALPVVSAYEDWGFDPCWSALPQSPQLLALATAWASYAGCFRDYERLTEQFRQELAGECDAHRDLPQDTTGQDLPTSLEDITYQVEWAFQRGVSSFQELERKFSEWLEDAPLAAHQLPAVNVLSTRLQEGHSVLTSASQMPASRQRTVDTSGAPEDNGNTAERPRGRRHTLALRRP